MENEKNKSILSKMFDSKNDYREGAIDIDRKEFVKTVESRRSIRIYNEEPVLEEDMKQCLELALLAPNSSNLLKVLFFSDS